MEIPGLVNDMTVTILWELARQFISPTSYSQKPWNYFGWNTWGADRWEGKLNSDNSIKQSGHLPCCYQQQNHDLIMTSTTCTIYNAKVWKQSSNFFSCSLWKKTNTPTPPPKKKARGGTMKSFFWLFSSITALQIKIYVPFCICCCFFFPLQGYRWISLDRKLYPSSQAERFIKLLIKVWVRA